MGAMKSLETIIRFVHTVRFLKFVQIFDRIRRQAVKVDYQPLHSPPERSVKGKWTCFPLTRTILTDQTKVIFLNQSGSVLDWHPEEKSSLWKFNLHYFDWLNTRDSEGRINNQTRTIEHWIANNPPQDLLAWSPYPTSLRIVNWIKWQLSTHATIEGFCESLALQAKVLSQELEYHLLGNHLFSNAKALVFVGAYFDAPVAEEWLQKGLAILDKEIPEQVLEDGGNFELSPMYHSLMLADVLDLINLSKTYDLPLLTRRSEHWREVAGRMLEWLEVMTHPDGEISFFNDSAIGIAASPGRLYEFSKALGVASSNLGYAEKPGKPVSLRILDKSGYVRAQHGKGTAIVDIAAVGPTYIPGHAHADTLSFEWDYEDQRVFVNSGTSIYGRSAERHRQRSTPAHNTVIINGQNSSQVWAGFRVGKRAQPKNISISSNIITASHSGYERWFKKIIHQRSWTFEPSKLTVEDEILGQVRSAVAHYHLHPAINVAISDSNSGSLILPTGKRLGFRVTGADIEISTSSWHPEFGKSLPSNQIILRFHSNYCQVIIDM